jgi:D-glycero-D-manno-heptose 1,7-bisphosphate phosphatase
VSVRALLCDRDGTLIEDVPYNADPSLVVPLPGVPEGLARARRHGLRSAVVTNQSGVAKGFFGTRDMEAVHQRLDVLLGPFDAICACIHDDEDGCACRKPQPGLILAAAAAIGVDVGSCAVVGDTAADVEAAHRAGALGILIPNGRTRPEEIAAAPIVAPTFVDAVNRVVA